MWDLDSDKKLMELVKINGPDSWDTFTKTIKNRTGKQCRERWFNHLNPLVKIGNWSIEESLLVHLMQCNPKYRN